MLEFEYKPSTSGTKYTLKLSLISSIIQRFGTPLQAKRGVFIGVLSELSDVRSSIRISHLHGELSCLVRLSQEVSQLRPCPVTSFTQQLNCLASDTRYL